MTDHPVNWWHCQGCGSLIERRDPEPPPKCCGKRTTPIRLEDA